MWRGTAISICRTARRSTTGMPLGELPADCFITIQHASPFLRVQANCWDNFLCYFVSNPTPQFSVSSDFPAITRPWVRQSYFEKIRVRFVDDLPNRDLTDAIIDAIDETTGVIAVSSVQYSTGTLVDVRRLVRSAQKVGAFLIVDATQAAGAMLVDASTLAADAVVTSDYKWLGGHGGVPLAAVS